MPKDNDPMTQLKMHTPDLSAQNVEKLLELFPNVGTETRDAKGNLVRGIDFDLLRQELADRIVEGPQERYRLDWPGKREAMLAANAPIAKTLRPCREESVDFDTTKNLFIEGDNLDALKLLQETYLGKVKLIYIDPPYNTGNDFIYEDDFAEDADTYLKRSNQKDEQGNRLVTNSESNGRFHSDWLNMMYPRLKLARNLLRNDGVIAISIDDHEIHDLRAMGSEIFGSESFVATIVWQKRYSRENRGVIGDAHEYLLLLARNTEAFEKVRNLLPMSEGQESVYKNPNNDPKGRWRGVPMTAQGFRPNQMYPITTPAGNVHLPPEGRCWSTVKAEYEKLLAQGRVYFGKNGDAQPSIIRYMSEVEGVVPWTWWPHEDAGHTDEARKEIRAIFGTQTVFETPKPVRLVVRLLEIAARPDDLILDFYAGSATTAHAVISRNAADGGRRRFILVQYPEPMDIADFKSISDVAKERIRRVGKDLLTTWGARQPIPNPQPDLLENVEPESAPTTPPDVGFRVLKIDTSNFDESFYRKPDEVHQTELLSMVDNIKPDRSGEDLLFQVLLDWGVDLALPIVRETLQGKTVYFVDGTALAACFDPGVDEALIREIAARKPLRVVFRDSSYNRDDTKINAVQIFAQLSPTTDVRTL